MWLKYGLAQDGSLIPVEDVPKGKTNLICLYCGSPLTAKKGKVKAHHFAHSGPTCKLVARQQVPSLPLYDNFNLHLSPQELLQHQQLWREYGHTNYSPPHVPFSLVLKKLFVWNNQLQPPGYGFTNLGKIPVNALSLQEFNQVQEPLILEKLQQLSSAFKRAKLMNSSSLPVKKADWQMYCAQFRRILQLQLYFLKVSTSTKIIYKIGVTKRTIEERVAEVARDLRPHFDKPNIEVLGTWPHRGNVELYFKHRYQSCNYPLGSLTEYFYFEDVESVLADLQGMEDKVLNSEELELLAENGVF